MLEINKDWFDGLAIRMNAVSEAAHYIAKKYGIPFISVSMEIPRNDDEIKYNTVTGEFVPRFLVLAKNKKDFEEICSIFGITEIHERYSDYIKQVCAEAEYKEFGGRRFIVHTVYDYEPDEQGSDTYCYGDTEIENDENASAAERSANASIDAWRNGR